MVLKAVLMALWQRPGNQAVHQQQIPAVRAADPNAVTLIEIKGAVR